MFLILTQKFKVVGASCTMAMLIFSQAVTAVSPAGTAVSQQEAHVAAAKRTFLLQNKKLAEEEWIQQQNAKADARALAENVEILKNEARVVKAEAEKRQTVKKAIGEASKDLESAQRNAQKVAGKLKKLAKQAKRETKQTVQEKDLGDGIEYVIGDGGRSEWKSFEYHTKSDGRPTFNLSSRQYALSLNAYTGKYGIRMVDGRYCVAVGSRFGQEVGTKLDVIFESGIRIKCIMGDQKADRDTDETNSYHLADGSYLEFIADRNAINSNVKRSGSFGVIDELSGKIKKFIVYR